MNLKTIRLLCIVGLPIVLASSSLCYFLLYNNQWSEYFYIVSLTANIGYFTNFLAIKMLFKPYEKTAFGRQGLIPKNQHKLSDSLSKTLIDNFLSKEMWQEYLIKSDVVNKVIAEAKAGSQNWLLDKENQDQIRKFLIQYLEDNQEALNDYINNLQGELVGSLTKDLDLDELATKGFEWLDKQFEENPAQLNQLIEPIIKVVAENIPEIANSLVTALDKHIESRDTFKRGIAKVARWSADISEEDIKQYLFRMVASFEFRRTLKDGLHNLISEYQNINKENSLTSKTDINFSTILSKMVSSSLNNIDWSSVIISNFLNKKSTKDKNEIGNLLLSIHQLIFSKVEKELSDGPLHSWIVDELVSMIDKLDLRAMVKEKANNFSPRKIENLFQTMISEQLVFIELLGAILGALSGLALIDIRVFAALAIIVGSYYLLDCFLSSRRNQVS